MSLSTVNVAICICGSTEAAKFPLILKALDEMIGSQKENQRKVLCKIISTRYGFRFCSEEEIRGTFEGLKFVELNGIYKDEDEWTEDVENKKVLHIEIRDAIDCLVVMPCSANTLAKITSGVCDNLLTSVLRSWNFGKAVKLFPSMNQGMWEHPITAKQVELAKLWGYACETVDVKAGGNCEIPDSKICAETLFEMVMAVTRTTV